MKSKKPRVHNVEQNTEEWHKLRLGKITASHFGEIMAWAFDKKTDKFNAGYKWGEGAKNYALRLALEIKTGKRLETFKNDWMKRGNELEPKAIEAYEAYTFTTVLPGGFAELDGIGASSDGIVNEGGGEVKSVAYNTHFKRLKYGGFDKKYKWQIYGQMWLYDFDWVDFISYCPEFNEEKQLYVFRVVRDEEAIKQLKARLYKFKELIQENLSLL